MKMGATQKGYLIALVQLKNAIKMYGKSLHLHLPPLQLINIHLISLCLLVIYAQQIRHLLVTTFPFSAATFSLAATCFSATCAQLDRVMNGFDCSLKVHSRQQSNESSIRLD